EARNMEQWFMRITAYADELLQYDLPPGGEWPERTMTIQRNWIGRSEGAEVIFRIEELDTDIPVFTTRPDTLFGATFFVIAPDQGEDSAHTQDEVLVNSEQFTGMATPEAKEKIVEWLREQGRGAPAVSYRLRDWSMSRQRYWGCPIPIVHCERCGLVPVPDEQ